MGGAVSRSRPHSVKSEIFRLAHHFGFGALLAVRPVAHENRVDSCTLPTGKRAPIGSASAELTGRRRKSAKTTAGLLEKNARMARDQQEGQQAGGTSRAHAASTASITSGVTSAATMLETARFSFSMTMHMVVAVCSAVCGDLQPCLCGAV